MADRRIEYIPVDELVERFHPDNPKDHDIGALHMSMDRFGFSEPVLLCERTGMIAAGHGRILTAQQMSQSGKPPPDGIQVENTEWQMPVVRGWESANDDELRAYLIASNRLVEIGGWDNGALIQHLSELRDTVGLDGLGYDEDDLQRMLDAASWHERWRDRPEKEDGNGPDARVKSGDLWRCGNAMIFCGDSTLDLSWETALDGQRPDLMITDPPYGIAYSGGAGAARNSIEADSMSGAQLEVLLSGAFGLAKSHLRPGAVCFTFAPTGQEIVVALQALQKHGMFRWTLVWAKDRLLPSRSDFNQQHETIVEGKVGSTSISEGEILAYGWNSGAAHRRPNAGPDAALSTLLLHHRKPSSSDWHPTEKPVELLGYLVDISTEMGDLVVDPFAGSGSTLVAAALHGRSSCGIELEPRHVSSILTRLEEAVGSEAVLIDRQ